MEEATADGLCARACAATSRSAVLLPLLLVLQAPLYVTSLEISSCRCVFP
jgi:hypothetical protein